MMAMAKPEKKRALPPGAAASSVPSGYPDPPRRVLAQRSVMMKGVAPSRLEDLCIHVNVKISNIKKLFPLRRIVEDDSFKPMLRKMQHEVGLVHGLLDKMESEVKQQEKLNDALKKLQKSVEMNHKEAQKLLQQFSRHPPKPSQTCNSVPTVKPKEQTKAVGAKPKKKPAKEKKVIKEAALITTEEFESVPAYLKGRMTCDQINTVVQEINKAVVKKYKILYQPVKSMNASVKNLYHRFIEEETKDTKGAFFIVDNDIIQFTELKLDKRFHTILSILRHCRRLREVRGSGLTRYIIC